MKGERFFIQGETVKLGGTAEPFGPMYAQKDASGDGAAFLDSYMGHRQSTPLFHAS